MHIRTAIIHEAVDTIGIRYAAVPISKELRVFWIFLYIVDMNTLLALLRRKRFSWRESRDIRTAAACHTGDQQTLCHLAFRVAGLRIFFFIDRLEPFDEYRICSVGHIQDADRISHGSVKIIFSFFRTPQLRLEDRAAIKVIKGDHFHVFDIALIVFGFCIKRNCHCLLLSVSFT